MVEIFAQQSQIRRRRQELCPREQLLASALVASNLSASVGLRSAETVAAYAAVDGEISLAPVISWLWESGVRVTFPAIGPDDSLCFVPSRPGESLLPGRFGIGVPAGVALKGENWSALDVLCHDAVLMPGVLFGPRGARVGRGRGYYDRALRPLTQLEDEDEDEAAEGRLEGSRPVLIGIGHEFQWTPGLPRRAGDAPVDVFVSPWRIRQFRDRATPWDEPPCTPLRNPEGLGIGPGGGRGGQ